jgi:hypothetical protein
LRVLVYVEGPADRASLERLLQPVISSSRENRVSLRFIVLGNKSAILNGSPRKAAGHLSEHPGDWVFVLPDLYPMAQYDGTENEHRSPADLRSLLNRKFQKQADSIGVPSEARDHFRVHCLKHDLEALLLASTDQLRQRLRTKDALKKRWRTPVEDQNDGMPPKRVVEALFSKYRPEESYVDTIDAPWILERANLQVVIERCPQCFAVFVSQVREAWT